MATYAIGDIQGCFDEFKHLLDIIDFQEDRDQLWITGDLVNRGPDSLKVLQYTYTIRDNVIVVLGNHDLHLLATAYSHNKPGKKDTLQEIFESPDRNVLLEWLRHCPLIHHDQNIDITMVHAGIHPDWTVEKAVALAHEVEKIIQGDQHVNFYRHMYGDKPTHWSDGLKSWPRYRYITNILTRLRYCTSDGAIALHAKGPPGTQPEGMDPWFDVKFRASRKQPIIFGHWSTLSLADRQYTNVYPLDTGCLWGGKLTAMRIDEKPYQTFQVSCPGAQTPE